MPTPSSAAIDAPHPAGDSRIVLDTNTVMALWLFADPTLAHLAAAIGAGAYRLFTRDDALDELRCVLAYRQFGLPPTRQQDIVAEYAARCQRVAPAAPDAPQLPTCRDRDDQKFLEIAALAPATHLLTRDKALLKLARHRMVRDRFAILTPERFVAAALPGSAGPR